MKDMSPEDSIGRIANEDREYPFGSDKWYISEYLRCGSVEEVFKKYRWGLYISEASYHRLVKKYGIIKNTGRREVSLTELLHFFTQKALVPTSGLETLYYQSMPPSFQTSLATLHRTYNNILNRNPVRCATALFIKDEDKKLLLGKETKTTRRLGKHKGDFSVPMTFSQYDEPPLFSILRVLQQEALVPLAIEGQMGSDSKMVEYLRLKTLSPLLFFDILDVRVSVYELTLPSEYTSPENTKSYKLDDLSFHSISEVLSDDRSLFRVGVHEMIHNVYAKPLLGINNDKIYTSELNLTLLAE